MAKKGDRNPVESSNEKKLAGIFADGNPYKSSREKRKFFNDKEQAGDAEADDFAAGDYEQGEAGFRFKKSDKAAAVAANTGFRLVKTALRKGGPIGFVLGTLGVGGLLAGTLLAPAATLQRMSELLIEKFNTQDISTEVRTRKLSSYVYKKMHSTGNLIEMKNGAFGFGKKKVRFGTVSQKMIDALEQQNIKIEYDTDIMGRKRIASVEVDDPSLGGRKRFSDASEFLEFLEKNTEFSNKIVTSLRGKFGGLYDRVGKFVRNELGVSHRLLGLDFKNKSYEENLRKRVTDKVETAEQAKSRVDGVDTDSEVDSQGRPRTPEEIDTARASKEFISEGLEETTESAKTGVASNYGAARILGAIDNISDACSFYNLANQVIYAAKVAQVAMRARYAATILTTASAIKAGEVTEEEASAVINMLTKTRPQEKIVNGQSVVVGYEKTAMESQGMQYVLTGMTGPLNESAKKAQPGLNEEGAVKTILEVKGKLEAQAESMGFNVPQFCKIMDSWAVQGLVILGTAISCIFGCAGLLAVGALGKSFMVSAGMVAGKAWIAHSIQKAFSATDIVGKDVDPETSGNVLVAGTGAYLGRIAMAGGNAPLERQAALDFLAAREAMIEERAEIVRQTHSPFDITTRHTMMGSIANSLTLHASKMHSAMGRLSGILSIGKMSLGKILPSAKALEGAEKRAAQEATMDLCMDPDYRKFAKETKVAMDPFCNIIFGVPIDKLDSPEYAPHMVLEYFAPGTFQKDENGKVTDELEDYQIEYKFDANGNLLNYRQARKQGEKIEKYLAGVLGNLGGCGYRKGRASCGVYFKPVDKNGNECSFAPIIVNGMVISKGFSGFYYTGGQVGNPCFSEDKRNYEFEWKIDDRNSQCSYGFGLTDYETETAIDENGEKYTIEWVSGYRTPIDCPPGREITRLMHHIQADYQNRLLNHKVNCIDRGEVPFGLEDLQDHASEDEIGRGDDGLNLAEAVFGTKKRLLDTGKECILRSGDKQRIMFALYFIDERVQCMLDGNQDCDGSALVSP